MKNIEKALASLNILDPNYPRPAVADILMKQENRDLLEYVYRDPFGAHVFPGDIDNYSATDFFADLNHALKQNNPIHLWAYIPTCRYRCHFCQFPIVLINPKDPKSRDMFTKVIDLNISEARLWLKAVPHLADVPIGEFNLFGGTPSLLPVEELERLLDFYRTHFNFSEATLRLEGEPGSLTLPFLTAASHLGITKISFGAQSFSDEIIRSSGRMHNSQNCFEAVHNARMAGFEWISVDLIYGLRNQTVDLVRQDILKARELNLEHLVCTKLHLEDFMKTRTGVSMQRPSVWQKKIKGKNDSSKLNIPSLGEQYQMREIIDDLLLNDYNEHPNMYYYKKGNEPEKWKGIITDQDKQFPEIAIGVGGSSKCRGSESINYTEFSDYENAVINGKIPILSTKGISPLKQEIISFKMALSTCHPVIDEIHKEKFYGKSFFDNDHVLNILTDLEKKELIEMDSNSVTLTKNGRVLSEAIINTI
ncbi:oxygen-independent coproporphyrinogen-3 oxidase [Pseudochrobactrum saccharolyticum]|uniref:Oxygen-independent coproporphyrinogen-3 oxidase n=1 Tax=Pseudochrobactrum saccharolyticum TaxID=354352 RepID=A0A7W8EPR0_9HYPH|nr:radical SAM protein [Pseudochrobactrum saccharolyticum]KAB0538318.1 radical SAM protein [Pseudochrobactrum saccharolyticum]MBB5091574.1 oxygen-independent coproporphyrinogen-3 oxidase [Pseudochrobactrum saccharolyticum]